MSEKEKKPEAHISRLVVKAGKPEVSYEIEFEFPYGTTTEEFEDARQKGLGAIRKWLNEKPPVHEEIFNILKWEITSGPKLGDFETADKSNNQSDPWQQAWNILKANNATLNQHYRPEGFTYFYWLYPEKYAERIFRKKHSQPQESKSQKSGG